MSHKNSRSHCDPYLLHLERHCELSTLREAKLAAWAFAIGEGAPTADSRGRRAHRGLLSDLPAPEPPSRQKRPSLSVRLIDAAARLFSSFRPAAGLPAGAAARADSPSVARIARTDAVESCASAADADIQPIQQRAA